MTSKKFAGVFLAIFVLGAFPLLLVQPSGAASAGLSAGFSAPVNHLFFMLLFIAIGVCAAALKRRGVLMLPLSVIVMLFIGASLEMNEQAYPFLRHYMLGAILLYAVAVSVVRTRAFLLCATVFGSFAFHLGGYYTNLLPEIAAPIYYLLGVMVCKILLMAIGVSMGVTLFEGVGQVKWRDRPIITSLFSIFW